MFMGFDNKHEYIFIINMPCNQGKLRQVQQNEAWESSMFILNLIAAMEERMHVDSTY